MLSKRILVVDDEIVSRKKITKILSAYGDVIEVATGEDALIAFKHAFETDRPFDLVSLDIGLPDSSGIDVLCHIRQIEESSSDEKVRPVKALMVTSHSDRDSVLTSIQAGCSEYVIKPFNRASIRERLSNLGFVNLNRLG